MYMLLVIVSYLEKIYWNGKTKKGKNEKQKKLGRLKSHRNFRWKVIFFMTLNLGKFMILTHTHTYTRANKMRQIRFLYTTVRL